LNDRGKIHGIMSHRALFVGLCGGIISVLVDADHLFWGIRAWHLPLLIISSLILCGCGAYLGRLLFIMVLSKQKGDGKYR